MLGLLSRGKKDIDQLDSENQDVAKLFFDSFSKRVGSVEEGLRKLSSDIEKLKVSVDQSRISDIVLLERLQKAEKLLGESILWIKTMADRVSTVQYSSPGVIPESSVEPTIVAEQRHEGESVLVPARRLVSVSGDMGTLPSITTPTELQALTLLATGGPKSAPEIGRVIGRSREHTARLMKKLFQEGYIRRDQTRIPFRYSLTERVRQTFKKPEAKDGEKEAVSVPQT